MTTTQGVGEGSERWGMLAVVSLGIFALTLNWFDVATAFPLIGAEFKVGLGPLSLLISLYIVGYGLIAYPGGMLATKHWHEEDPGTRASCARNRRHHVRAVPQLHRARLLPSRQRHRRIGVRRHDGRSHGRLVPRERRHPRPRHHRRRRLQRGSRVRSLRLAVRAASDGWHTSLVLAGVFELSSWSRRSRRSGFPEGDRSLGGVRFDRRRSASRTHK